MGDHDVTRKQNGPRPILLVTILVGMTYLWAAFVCGPKIALVGLTPIVLFFALLALVMKMAGFDQAVRRISWLDWAATALVAVSLIAFVVWFISGEEWFYIWDSRVYWYQTSSVMSSLETSIIGTAKSVYASVNNDQYNLLIPGMMAVPLKMLGGSRAAFDALTVTIFLIPMAAASTLAVRLVQDRGSETPLWLGVLLGAGMPMMLSPALSGRIDAAPALVLAVAFALIFQNMDRPLSRFCPRYVVALGLLMFVMVSFRRTFTFAAVGVAAGIVVCSLFLMVRCANRGASAKFLILNYGVAAAIVVLGLIVLFPGYLDQIITNNFSSAYSAYNIDSNNIALTARVIAYPLLVLIIVGGLLAVRHKKRRRQFACLLAASVVSLVMFWRIQNMSEQHYYIIAPATLMLCVLSLGLCVSRLKLKERGNVYASTFVAVVAAYALISVPASSVWADGAPQLIFSSQRHAQQRRPDLAEVRRLVYSVPEGDSIYVCSSSVNLCDDLFSSVLWVDGNSRSRKVYSANVDLRDGFNPHFFTTDYVVVATPYQTHLKAGSQKVVTDLAPMVMDARGPVGSHFELIKTFKLWNDVTAYLYKRVIPFDDAEVTYVSNHFRDAYPDHDDLFYDKIVGVL